MNKKRKKLKQGFLRSRTIRSRYEEENQRRGEGKKVGEELVSCD